MNSLQIDEINNNVKIVYTVLSICLLLSLEFPVQYIIILRKIDMHPLSFLYEI